MLQLELILTTLFSIAESVSYRLAHLSTGRLSKIKSEKKMLILLLKAEKL